MAFNLIGKFGLDGSGFFSGLRNVESQAQSRGRVIGSRLAGGIKSQLAAVFATGAIAAAVKNRVEDAGQIRDQSTALGISTEAFQENRFAAEQSNISHRSLIRSQQRLARAIGETREGSEEYVESLKRLGLTEKDLLSNDLQGQFLKIADHVKQAEVNTQLLNDVQVVLGRTGTEVIPVFKAGFREMTQIAHDTGNVIEDSVIQKLAKAGDKATTISGSVKKKTSEALPVVFDIAEKLFTGAQLKFEELKASLSAGFKTGSGKAVSEAITAARLDFFIEKLKPALAAEELTQRKSAVALANTPDLVDRDEPVKPASSDENSLNVSDVGRSQKTQPVPLRESNQLSRIGLFPGGKAGQFERSFQDSNRHLRRISNRLDRIDERIGRAF